MNHSFGPPQTDPPQTFPWVDRIGALLAGLCAVHCFVLMLGSAVLSFSAVGLLFNPTLHWLLTGIAMGLVTISLFGPRRFFGPLPAALMIGGLVAVITANLWGTKTLIGECLSCAGGLSLAMGHGLQLIYAKHAREKTRELPKRGPRTWAFFLTAAVLLTAILLPPAACRFLPSANGRPTAGATIDWSVLAQLDTQSGIIGPELKKVVTQTVRVPGFVVPLDEVGEIFLLTPHGGACIHGATLPMNQVIFVKMQHAEARIDPWAWEPIWVTGKLNVQEVDSPFGSAGFQMEGLASESYY